LVPGLSIQTDRTESTTIHTLGWAFYLASSWTWCIGMFFPILLLRDYGWWGFLTFAAPNVVGAGAMGWVLAKTDAPAKLLDRHRFMVQFFSIVTMLFQAFFLGWMMRWAGVRWPSAGVLTFALLVGLVLLRSGLLLLAFVVCLISVGCLIGAWQGSVLSLPAMTPPPTDLLWIAPVSFFGFAFCPYLDPTFLRAAQSTTGPSRKIAFTLGFGVFFLLMILFTTLYGSTIDQLRTNAQAGTIAAGLIFFHIAAQLGCTTFLHWRELAHTPHRPKNALALTTIAIAGVAIVSFVLPLDAPWIDNPSLAHMGSGEVLYRIFLSFYGLLFPAYVWLCMIPTPDGHAGLAGPRGRHKGIVLLLTVVLAAPLYWRGFLQLQEVFLAPGLLLVLLARLLVRKASPTRVDA